MSAVPSPERPDPLLYSILMEDERLIAANKLAAIPVQRDKTGDASLQDMLAALIPRRGKAPPYLEAVHRLDRRSSGIVLFAKDRKSAGALGEQFRPDGEGAAEIRKTYWAVVEAREGGIAEGRLEHRLSWDPRKGKAFLSPADSGGPGKPAALEYREIGRSDRYALLEVRPLTGRSHQIRAQLSAAGMPIRGDLKYGARRSSLNGLIMLHARTLAFRHPSTDEEVSLTAPPPASEALWEAFSPGETL